MNNSNGGGSSIVVLIVLVAVAILVRRGRLASQGGQLAKGERIRPLAITLLDPVVSLILVGTIAWRFATVNTEHVALAIIGGLAGVGIAWARARVMFVRALRATRSVVLRRSNAEYALLGLLIVLRLVDDSYAHSRTGNASLILAPLTTLAILESITRSGFIVAKYFHDEEPAPATPPDVAG